MNDCCDQPGLTPMDSALTQLLEAAKSITDIVQVSLVDALGCVLAQDQLSTVDVPPADNSAMDGYAVRSQDIALEEATSLPISQRIPAGVAPDALLAETTARIFTGAEIPLGADAVVMQEDVVVCHQQVVFTSRPAARTNIRPRGQDIARGAVVVPRGQRLRAQELGLLASVGIATVPIYRKLKIAILSTGDELVEPGCALAPGQIYNSNRYTLAGLIHGMGFEVIDLGIIADTVQATEAALLIAVAQADCIISSGGVSEGEEDHVKNAIEKLGALHLWKLAIKPGKPLAFGEVKGKPFIGLPGNPSAVFVTFCMLARPFLLKMQGAKTVLPLPIKVAAAFAVKKLGRRQEYLRAKLQVGEAGEVRVHRYDNQSSGVLASAAWGDGLAIVPVNTTIAEGDLVDFIFYDSVLK